ncbi:sporulation protein YtxC [Peribacillus cavernae]|uniref:sporulation protein YtxC n=1 Tax=Peribacillus cavernae TaxID=1674310 RepID=UPI00163C5202|nr:sporulation protein YtxC [Peribacillus cavernae]MDQ0220100.1 putative sporulation protein YtxC [Peribacillus cavernae]
MVQIHFQSETEALKLLEYVSVHPLGTELNEYIQFQPEQGLFVTIQDKYPNNLLSLLSDVFYSFLLEDKLLNRLEMILRHKFFYREREEIDDIIEIACSIIEGGDKQRIFERERKIIGEGLQSFLAQKVSFSFDSFATFRLKSFYDSLQGYVEAAIDEYKLEQDYQSFIATLRDLLYEREPKMEIVHLLHRNGYHFFDEGFRRLGKYEIFKMIDKKLLAENPIYIDSTALAPLISIAPYHLNLYTDEAEDGLVQTITRIFEERTVILPIASFNGDPPAGKDGLE